MPGYATVARKGMGVVPDSRVVGVGLYPLSASVVLFYPSFCAIVAVARPERQLVAHRWVGGRGSPKPLLLRRTASSDVAPPSYIARGGDGVYAPPYGVLSTLVGTLAV